MEKEKHKRPGKMIRNLLLILVTAAILLALLRGAGLFRHKRQTDLNADHTPPSIFLTRDNRYYVEPGEPYEEEGYAAYDDTDGDLTKKVEVTVSEDIVQYKVQDSAGNITIRYRRIPYGSSESLEDR